MGVAALGARRKMLKTFEVVRRKMGLSEEGGGHVDVGESVRSASSAGGGANGSGNGMTAA